MTASYPLHIRTILRAGKSRSQPAAFRMAEPRRGFGYVQEIGTDTPVFWDVTWRFTPAEALVFRLWFTKTIRRGVDEFTMPIRTEFGTLTHTCRFLPDSLMDTSESGETFGYRATLMARAEVIPQDYSDAADLIVELPDWMSWAGLLDRTATVEMPLQLNPIGALFTTGTDGAWYEPARLTTVTRDTAGATPITGYGQTIGRIADAGGRGNHATQATSGSRPLIARAPAGGARNLLQRTQELGDAYWSSTELTVTANATTAPDGTATADKLVESSTVSVVHNLFRSISWAAGTTYTLSLIAKAAERSIIVFLLPAAAFGVDRVVECDLGAGTITSVTSGATAAVEILGGGWARWSITASATASVSASISIRPRAVSGTSVYTGDGTSGFYAWGMQLEAGAAATEYQRVEEAHNVSDVGEFRRNMLTLTEVFDNSAWTKVNLSSTGNAAIAPDGTTTADRLQVSVSTSVSHQFVQNVAATELQSGRQQTGSVHLKPDQVRYVRVHISDAVTPSAHHCRAEFDLLTGTVSGALNVGDATGAAGSVEGPFADGSYRCIVSGIPRAGSTNGSRIEVYTLPSLGSSAIYAGTIGDGFYAWGAQLEEGSSPTTYQRVGDTYQGTHADTDDTFRLVFDGVDDAMTTTFAASLGSNCTVARAIPDVGAQILTSQVIDTTFSNTISHAGMLIVNRSLTADETAMVTGYLNKLAGVG